MATFIELRTDSYAENLNKLKRDKVSYDGVRRPLRGIEIKDDTYAVMKVITADGTEIPLVDAAGTPASSGQETQAGSGVVSQTYHRANVATTKNYTNFIIQSIVDSRQEKQQIIETFGESYVFFFGERPRVLQVSGVLLNTLDFNWRTEFWYNYEKTLRGTKLVEMNARLYLHWDDVVVEGYILGAQAQDDANNPYHVSFAFTMFVTNHTYLSAIGDDAYPIRNSTYIEPLQNALGVSDLLGDSESAIAQDLGREDALRKASVGARQPQYNATQVLSVLEKTGREPSKFNVGKNIVANAIAVGVQAQNLTFLSLVSRFFHQRKQLFPRGLAGSASNTGGVQLAGIRREDTTVKRTGPLRTKLRYNRDEYVVPNGGDAFEGLDYNIDKEKNSQSRQEKIPNKNALERQALGTLVAMGIDPTQHGEPERTNIFENANNFVATGGKPFDSGATQLAVDLGFQI